MIISVASGKGGAGKTFVATHLATALCAAGKRVVYVDADVEEPNGHLFLKPHIDDKKSSSRLVPSLPSGRCIGCGNCQSVCAFNAIVVLGSQVTVVDALCHGCGACLLACEHNYLSETRISTGEIEIGRTDGTGFISGTLNVGEPRSAPMVRDVVHTAIQQNSDAEFIIIDAPPGTSCNAVAAIDRADLVLLVAEPTRLGFHDFKLAHEMTRVLHRNTGVVINRSDMGNDALSNHVQEQGLPLLQEIPFSDIAARRGTQGKLVFDDAPDIGRHFTALAAKMIARRAVTGGVL